MSPYSIRNAVPADRSRWDQLWQGYLVFYEHELAPNVTETTWRRLLSDDPATVCLIAADADDQAQGFAHIVLHPSTWAEAPYCYLEDLFVEPNLRASGIGRALINEIYRRADENGWPYVYWKTQENNYRARALYDQVAEREGFQIYARWLLPKPTMCLAPTAGMRPAADHAWVRPASVPPGACGVRTL